MNCLWCDQEVISEMSWQNILNPVKKGQLCLSCEDKLELLGGDRCNVCSRITKERTCADCKKWSANPVWRETLLLNHSVFNYNEMMKEIITKWKFRGDYVLGNVFREQLVKTFKEEFPTLENDALIVPIPLSKERLAERGFNQAKMLADFLPLNSEEVISRIHSEKQAKKTRYERISTKNPFIITEKVTKTIVLVDDIYTTGTTLRHAGKLLKENGCQEVFSFTLARG